MSAKSTGKSSARAGANLAQGWENTSERAREWAKAQRALLTLINDVTTYESRMSSDYVVKTLAHKWLGVATLEEVRALVMELKEELGL